MDHQPLPAEAGVGLGAGDVDGSLPAEPLAKTLVLLALRAIEELAGPRAVDTVWQRAATGARRVAQVEHPPQSAQGVAQVEHPPQSAQGVAPVEHPPQSAQGVAPVEQARESATPAECEPTACQMGAEHGLGATSFEQLMAVLAAAKEVLGRPDFPREAGARMFELGGEQRIGDLLRCVGGPAEALALLCDIACARAPRAEMTVEAQGARFSIVAFRVLAPDRPRRDLCGLVSGMLGAVPTVFGLPGASVRELQCQLAGASQCLYDVVWDPQRATGTEQGHEAADREQVLARHVVTTAAIDGLLELAVALARSNDATAMAKLAARAGSVIGGTGQIVVVLWDRATGQLVEAARHPERSSIAAVRRPAVSACGPLVARLAQTPTPVSFTVRGTEPVVHDLCRLAGFDDGSLVPVVSHGVCHGILLVDVDVSSGGPPAPVAVSDRLAGLGDLLAAALHRLSLIERTHRQTYHDELTGLANERLLRALVDQALAGARRQGRRCCLLFLDCDGLASVNAAHGSEGGDRVLRLVAQRLRDAVRGGDAVARVGGDELVVLLASTPTVEEALSVAGRLARQCAEPILLGDGTEVAISVTIGVAASAANDNVDTLLARADAAMARGKASGPGQVVAAA